MEKHVTCTIPYKTEEVVGRTGVTKQGEFFGEVGPSLYLTMSKDTADSKFDTALMKGKKCFVRFLRQNSNFKKKVANVVGPICFTIHRKIRVF